MKLNTNISNKKYFIAGNIVYKIETASKNGATTNKDEDFNSFVPTIKILKESKTQIDAKGDKWNVEEIYYLDTLIDIGDKWEKTGNFVTKVDSTKTLFDYFFEQCKLELEEYISKNPSITYDSISKNNKTNIPNWVFSDINDDEWDVTLDGDGINEKRLNLNNIINSTKQTIVSNLVDTYIEKQTADLVKYKESLASKYGIEVK